MQKHTEKDDKVQREVAGLRGEAKGFATIGGLGGLSWGALEIASYALPEAKTLSGMTSKGMRNIAFASGAVALGGLTYAVVKHSRANNPEQENKHSDQNDSCDWQSKLASESEIPGPGGPAL